MQVQEEAERREPSEDSFTFSRGTGTQRIKKEQISWEELENPYQLRRKYFERQQEMTPGLSFKSIIRYKCMVVAWVVGEFVLSGCAWAWIWEVEVFSRLIFSCLYPAFFLVLFCLVVDPRITLGQL